ncbi:hypothetical protein RIF29_24095 [Crotalaria pallida]|uniref:PAP/OAS1 substrate-binding-related domain-containing protein n=1 Tax=Crotalaria pallida TaxID=3830 RepID=A0AAN9EJW3_CROPI
MGEHEILLNGLLADEDAASVMRALDTERWLKAEERTVELIACIQPNQPSEERRNVVADYVQRLMTKCFPCQVCDMLKNEEKDASAEFRVREVQYIQAEVILPGTNEVKIIKCLVEDTVVDISFNQLEGLCTLCFLEEVDNLINQNHLFKRSIMLIKAWCYYESRLVGAHHGLISTYALETLVLYIFHVFNNSFAGPLEVLYRFLEFFSKFDWDNFCVSLWDPVPINSLPDVTADPPRKDGGDLLLSKLFLEACSSVYAVFPGSPENQGQPFVSKYFNVIDPLRVNNNFGRSVGKVSLNYLPALVMADDCLYDMYAPGNFYRIRSAFALGAKQLARLLDCPKEELFLEINQFFMNTWKRHGNGQRPDAPNNDLWRLRLSSHNQLQGSENLQNNSQKVNNTSNGEFLVKGIHVPESVVSHHSNLSSEKPSKSIDVSRVSHSNQNNARIFDEDKRESNRNQGAHVGNVQRDVKLDNPFGDVRGRFLFARTHSSPELADSSGEVSSQGRRIRAPESGKNRNSSAKLESSHKNNVDSEKATSNGLRTDNASARHNLSNQGLDGAAASTNGSNNYHDESGSGIIGEEFASIAAAGGTHMMNQEEQDFLNMMTAQGFAGQAHVPFNFAPEHLPLPFSPSILASIGYAQRNMELIESGNENFSSVGTSPAEAYNDFWHEQERLSARGVEVDDGNFEMLPDDKQKSISDCYNVISSSHLGSSSNSGRLQQKFAKENRGSSAKSSKSTREKRGRKNAPPMPSNVYGKGKNVSETSPNLMDDENGQWTPLETMASDI